MDGAGPLGQRARRTRLAAIRQELLSPVMAMLGYAEIAEDEVRRQGLSGAEEDMTRIVNAARELLAQVGQVLQTGGVRPDARDPELGAVEARIRHALRTPLNTVCGYGELLCDELEGLKQGETLLGDLSLLVSAARGLIERLDTIVDFSGLDPESTALKDLSPVDARGIEGLVRAIAPAPETNPLTPLKGRILLVDDNTALLEVLARRLGREGHEVFSVGTAAAALALLSSTVVDVVVLDLVMPEMNGYELLLQIRELPEMRALPVIMMSGLAETEGVVRCIAAGAIDYLVKPVNIVLLRARIGACLERSRWRAREATYLSQIEHLARHDTLTNLPNRAVLIERLEQAIAAARRDQTLGAVLFVDLDEFKPINDQFGHANGDAVLREAARRLTTCVRDRDTVARIGGDEFCILLVSVPDEALVGRVAGRLVACLGEPIRVGESEVTVGASVGIAMFSGQPESADSAMRRADRAMYAVKASGKRGFRFAEQSDPSDLAVSAFQSAPCS